MPDFAAILIIYITAVVIKDFSAIVNISTHKNVALRRHAAMIIPLLIGRG